MNEVKSASLMKAMITGIAFSPEFGLLCVTLWSGL
jgi:hypothetical protein